MLRRILLLATATTIALAAVAAGAVWIIVRHDVAHLRAVSQEAKPVAPVVKAALVATNGAGILARPRVSPSALFWLARPNVRSCAPTLSGLVVRNAALRRGTPRSQREAAITAAVVASMFTPEELLRIYAHEVYLGNIEGVEIYGIEAASAAYLHKPAHDLTAADAALLAGIVASPNALSPIRHPARAAARRERVLAQMRRL